MILVKLNKFCFSIRLKRAGCKLTMPIKENNNFYYNNAANHFVKFSGIVLFGTRYVCKEYMFAVQ